MAGAAQWTCRARYLCTAARGAQCSAVGAGGAAILQHVSAQTSICFPSFCLPSPDVTGGTWQVHHNRVILPQALGCSGEGSVCTCLGAEQSQVTSALVCFIPQEEDKRSKEESAKNRIYVL